jgi:uncharacterized protein (TIGR02246 family)
MDDVSEVIRANNLKFSDALLRGDARSAARLYTDDAHLLPPNEPQRRGKEAIAEFWRGMMRLRLKEARLETVDVEAEGDLACEVGRFAFVTADTAAGPGQPLNGKYVVVWKRVGKAWKIHADVWNADAA